MTKFQKYFMLAILAVPLAVFAGENDKYSSTIAQNQEMLLKNDFAIGRGAGEYFSHFGPSFIRDLESLGPKAHWMDSGAGSAKAMWEFSQGEPIEGGSVQLQAENLTALAYKQPEISFSSQLSQEKNRQFRYLEGKYLEEFTSDEIGKCHLITDLYGPFSYSPQVNLVLQKYIDLLEIGGILHIYYVPQSTKINNKASGLEEYLYGLRGLEVEISENGEALRIKKTADFPNYKVPQLDLQEFYSGKPPTRNYLLKSR